MASSSLLRLARLLHLYFGVFIAPAILFFAFTGALQTFNLHETRPGSNYIPPRWAVVLGQIHKKQTDVVDPPRTRPINQPPPPKIAAAEPNRISSPSAPSTQSVSRHSLPLKIFFLVVSIGLFISTFTGLYMSFRYNRNWIALSVVLLAGTLIPVLLVFV